jgi:hypothetical protein
VSFVGKCLDIKRIVLFIVVFGLLFRFAFGLADPERGVPDQPILLT